MRRALIAALLAASAVVPAAAQAQAPLVVTAVAKGYHGGFENMNVQFECAAAPQAIVTRCTFGKIAAPSLGPVAVGSANVRLGLPYDLCVTAVGGGQTVSRCAPFSYLTNTAVIAG